VLASRPCALHRLEAGGTALEPRALGQELELRRVLRLAPRRPAAAARRAQPCECLEEGAAQPISGGGLLGIAQLRGALAEAAAPAGELGAHLVGDVGEM